jgi:DNA polymerase-3 subunit chi
VPTHIDFYVLNRSGSDPLRFVCRLTETAYNAGHRIYIDTVDTEQAQTLDALLWTFSDTSFVPHRCTAAVSQGPEAVVIGHGCPADDSADVLLTLQADAPEYFTRFKRVAEFVHGDPQQRSSARQRYRFYQDHGVRIKTHQIDE